MADVAPKILKAFAELVPAGQRSGLDVTSGGHPLAWLALRSTLVGNTPEIVDGALDLDPPEPVGGIRLPREPALERLAASDALHEHERLLREGWVYLVGSAVVDGERRRVCHPLMSRPVTLKRVLGGYQLVPAGDLEITPLITDTEAAARLEATAQFGAEAAADLEEVEGWMRASFTARSGIDRQSGPPTGLEPQAFDIHRTASQELHEVSAFHPKLARERGLAGKPQVSSMLGDVRPLVQWVHEVGKAAGLRVDEVVDWKRPPGYWRHEDRVVAVVGAGLHLSRDVGRPGLGDVLRGWAHVPGINATAYGKLYAEAGAPRVDADEAVRSPLPLSDAQREVVRRSRTEPVVAVSGAPGNGKSHAVVAVALDAVAQGRNVLVATPSVFAADVIGELLYRQPGPDPVLFGSSASRREIAAELADGVSAVARSAADAAARADAVAQGRVAELEEAIGGLLATEALAGEAGRWEPLLPGLTRAAPGVFAADADLDAIAGLLADIDGDDGGLLAGLRRRLAVSRLRKATGVTGRVDVSGLRRAVAAARSRRAAAALAAMGGTRIGALWDELFAADAAASEALGARLRAQARHARVADRHRMAAVTGLATALRTSRPIRRQMLRELDGAALTAALPLWVGALTDIDDLLPPQPGLFDVVILDEASQIDQPRAAPALLRADTAVVVGDPRQLRHVSFVADADQRRALAEHGLGGRPQLDVRRVSAFDATAAVSPVSFLDEHHRSVPHLIGFSDRRFYSDRIKVRTRHPATEAIDAIRVIHVPDGGLDDGVSRAEVEAVAKEVDRLAAEGVTSIGVLSPFRAQADALEAMLLDRFDIDAIDRLGLRTGTVHAFQGAECDVIVLSLGLADTDTGQRRRFVADPNLCNVMVTRARHRMIIVTSLSESGDDLIGDLLAHAEQPPDPPPLEPSDAPWINAVAAEAERQGLPVRCGYRVGDDVLDLVIGDGADAVTVDCRVHPEGVAAHIASRRGLHQAGWKTAEAWASYHDHDPVRAALDLAARWDRHAL